MSSVQEMLTKPSANGVIRVPSRRGLVKFALGDDGPEFTLDVIKIYDEWGAIDDSYRDAPSADGLKRLAEGKYLDWTKARYEYASLVVGQAYAAMHDAPAAPVLSHGEAEFIMAQVHAEVEKLRNFIRPVSEQRPSSPESTEIRFSQ